MNKYFHEGMTVGELRTTLFTVVEGKTKEEIEEIKKEYSKILPIVLERQQKENIGWFAND
ncbi:hypothetical protein [Neglectibacter caecimuris]|uniref:hypothetical protein n=1 Tax=Neglectibacter caecimuris TaxID=3093658 RepID=UPI002AC96717|nr:hypothetical protein [Neglectibacter sp. M00184]